MKRELKQWQATVSAMFDAESAAQPEMRISTSAVDRDGDRVLAQGADLTNFLKNPTLLWAHDASSLPIGTVTRLDVQPNEIRAGWRWFEGDEFASRVKNAWAQGIVRAASIGFMPIAATPNDAGGYDYTRWELFELSLCPLPANPEAVRTLKALGLVAGYGFQTAASTADPELVKAIREAFKEIAVEAPRESHSRRVRPVTNARPQWEEDDDEPAPYSHRLQCALINRNLNLATRTPEGPNLNPYALRRAVGEASIAYETAIDAGRLAEARVAALRFAALIRLARQVGALPVA